MAAFAAAMEAGADGFELDVRLSACGKLLVFHDDDLLRLCGVDRRVQDLSWQELSALRVQGERIPLLDEVLRAFPSALVNVEMKAHPLPMSLPLAKATRDAVLQHRALARVLVSSFDPRLLAMLRALGSQVPRALLFHSKQATPLRKAWLARGLVVAAIHPEQVLVTAEMVARAHAQGRLLNTWTVDDPERILELAAIDVDAIICNDPGAAVALLEER